MAHLPFALVVASVDARFDARDPRSLPICTFEYEDEAACRRFANVLIGAGDVVSATIEGPDFRVIYSFPEEARA